MSALLLSVILSLQTPKDAPWPVHESVEGGFSIAFPGAPERRTEKASSPQGAVDVPTLILQKDDVVYAIFHHDIPPLPTAAVEKYLDNLRDGRKSQGRILQET